MSRQTAVEMMATVKLISRVDSFAALVKKSMKLAKENRIAPSAVSVNA